MEPDLPGGVLALTADPALERHLLSVTAALGVPVELHAEVDGLRVRWRTALVVLVGADRAARVAELGLPRRSEVYVLGLAGDRDRTHACSARLGAAVVCLPEGAGDLAEVLAERVGTRVGGGHSYAVLGGSGGVGASTLAAALALAAAREGRASLLVDLDPAGGGLDLLVGAERLPGWRWSRLASARGHLGDLSGQLPRVEGVDVLAADRGPAAPASLRAEQVEAVLASGRRSHATTVVDLPRTLDPAASTALRAVDQVLLVARADVRGVAAARGLVEQLAPLVLGLGLVVRLGRSRGLDVATAAEALALPLLAVVEDDPSVPAAAERGDPPGRAPRSPLGRSCRALLGRGEARRDAA